MTRIALALCAFAGLAFAAGDEEDPAALVRSTDAKDRFRAARALARRPGSHAALTRLLEDPDASVRVEAASALAGPGAGAAVDVLVALLDDREWYVRWRACLALRRTGRVAARAVPKLVALIERRDAVAPEAVHAGTAIAPSDPGLAVALARAVRDQPELRSKALDGLDRMTAWPVPRATALLVQVLRREDPGDLERVWDHAARFGELGLRDLAVLAGSGRDAIAVRALAALRALRRGRSRPAVADYFHGVVVIAAHRRALDADTDLVRHTAAVGLLQLGFCDQSVRDAVTEVVRSDDRSMKVRVAEGLAHRVGEDPWALEPLAVLSRDPDVAVRSRATNLLGWTGRAAVPILVERLGDANADVRHTASVALARLGAGAVALSVRVVGRGRESEVWLRLYPVREAQEELLALLDDKEIGPDLVEALGRVVTRDPARTLALSLRSGDKLERRCAELLVARVPWSR